jgi:dTDP-N-acetylfucosamine:lipid II N-acetylfucosaminyltransferase
MRVVHLARDEKFIPLMQSLFDAANPGANRYVIARRQRRKQRFVQPADNVVFRPEWQFRTPLIAGEVRDADCIVAHSMTTIFAKALRHARPDARVVWLGWGYDYYPLLEAQLGDPLLPTTRALTATLRGDAAAGSWWQRLFSRPGDDDAPGAKRMALSDVASRLNAYAVLPPEVALLRHALPQLRGEPHEVPLFTAEDVFQKGPQAMEGLDVLLGNSATASNNHVEALDWLRSRAGNARLVVPLSYGDAAYGQAVAAQGRERFGERLDALTGWMALADYNERIRHCGFVVMNHRRQQAVGNVTSALYKGATVYLRRENPLFDFLSDLGVCLRQIDDNAGALEALSVPERARNREIIGAHYARARVLSAIRALLGTSSTSP